MGIKKRGFIWLVGIAILLVITAVFGAVVYLFMMNHTRDRYFDIARGSAQMAASIIDGDRLEGYLLHGADESYEAAVKLLQELKIANNLRFLYIVKPGDGGIVYIFDIREGESVSDSVARLGVFAAVEDDVVVFDDFMDVYLTGQETQTPIIDDSEWGHLVSAYVPIFASDGRVVAVACADVDMATVINAAFRQSISLSAISFAVYLLVSIIIIRGYIKKRDENQALAVERERVLTELKVARNIQMRLLPSFAHPDISGRKDLDIDAFIDFGKEVGGNFYDTFFVDEDVIAVVIGNVSGNSISAALLMSRVMLTIKNSAIIAAKGTTEDIPHKVFETINDILYDSKEEDVAVTAFMGYLNLKTGEFSAVNAGHNPPLIKKGGGMFGFMEVEASFPLAGEKGRQYEKKTIRLDGGDMICLYTDSIVYAINNEGKRFANQGLLAAANGYQGLSAKGLIKVIQADFGKFTGETEQKDGIAMLAFQGKVGI
ncbi:MAG: SpoIIE family protein phosphatase [Clostridiales bacterium]|jgi:sigma-B regulation protein RsbU (phosphoserine phosphatase)|nr:SpoIIE family protein phosphatase [Clostridiales bacterium]